MLSTRTTRRLPNTRSLGCLGTWYCTVVAALECVGGVHRDWCIIEARPHILINKWSREIIYQAPPSQTFRGSLGTRLSHDICKASCEWLGFVVVFISTHHRPLSCQWWCHHRAVGAKTWTVDWTGLDYGLDWTGLIMDSDLDWWCRVNDDHFKLYVKLACPYSYLVD